MVTKAVIKFGGADLASGEKIAHAAKLVIESHYDEKIVVVSAMADMTDNLETALNILGSVGDEDYADVVSMGERASARVFCTALKVAGAKTELFDPYFDTWPIMTDSKFRDATPNFDKTKKLVKEYVEPILKTRIPVICGFIGKSEKGKITTLGRGGSDTTALLLARCLEADEIILVKQTSGILSADPKIVPDARFIDKLDIYEALDLVQGGAKIVKPDALKYKLPTQRLRIVSFDSENLSSGGTEITDSLNIKTVEAETHLDLLAINIVCEVNSENLMQALMALENKPIFGISSGKKSITLFTTNGNAKKIINRMHSVSGFKAISHRENVAMLQFSHPAFIDSPGGVSEISNTLSKGNINILEVTTSKATINVFIEEKQIKRAVEAINNVFKT